MKKPLLPKPDPIPEEDVPLWEKGVVYANQYTLRIAAILLAGTFLLIVIINMLFRSQIINLISPGRYVPEIAPYTNTIRFFVIVGAVIFVILSRSSGPEKVTRRHYRQNMVFLAYELVLISVLSGLLQMANIDATSIFIMAVIISAAFLQLKTKEFFLLYGFTGALMIVLLYSFQADKYIAFIGSINVAAVLVFTFFLSRVNYSSQVRNFLSQRIIERQKEDLATSNDMLYRLSYLDALTMVPNRRYFDEIIVREWKRAMRESTPLAILMIDIDHFKQFNDTYGHQAGDQCLKQVAAVLSKNIKRPGDTLSRYGGEEFVAILPNTGTEGAAKVAKNMCRAVKGIKNMPVGISVSIGVAGWGNNGGNIQVKTGEELIAAADNALYQAKELGRDRYVCAAGPENY